MNKIMNKYDVENEFESFNTFTLDSTNNFFN